MCLSNKARSPSSTLLSQPVHLLCQLLLWCLPILPQFFCSQTSLHSPGSGQPPAAIPGTPNLRFAVEGEPGERTEIRFVLSGCVEVLKETWTFSTSVLLPSSLQGCSSCCFKTSLRTVPCSRLHLGVPRALLHFRN